MPCPRLIQPLPRAPHPAASEARKLRFFNLLGNSLYGGAPFYNNYGPGYGYAPYGFGGPGLGECPPPPPAPAPLLQKWRHDSLPQGLTRARSAEASSVLAPVLAPHPQPLLLRWHPPPPPPGLQASTAGPAPSQAAP